MLQGIKSDFPSYPLEGAYLDSTTIGLQPSVSINSYQEYASQTGYTVRKSLHRRARDAERKYFESKETYASFIGAKPEQIAWVPSSDIAITLMLHSLLNSRNEEKPKVVSSVFEHHSIISPLLSLKQANRIDLDLLTIEEEPCIPEYVEKYMGTGDILILGHTTQLLGLYRDLKEISSSLKSLGGTFVVDFSRSAGQFKLDMSRLGLDIGIFDGSIDLLGPPSSGFVYLSDEMSSLQNPFPSSGNVGRVTNEYLEQISNVERFELGAPHVGSMYALKASLDFMSELGMKNIENQRSELQNYLIQGLNELNQIDFIDPLYDEGNQNKRRSSLVSLSGKFHSHDVALYLDESYNVQVRSGLLCSHPAITELGLEEVIQVSTHIYTDKADIDLLVAALDEILRELN